MRARLPNKSKPDSYTESCGVDVAGGWRERNVWYPGRPAWTAPKGVTVAILKKATLNAQESAEAIVPETGRAEVMQSGVAGGRRTAWRKQKTLETAAACKGMARNAKSIQERRVRSDRKLEKRKSGSRNSWKRFCSEIT